MLGGFVGNARRLRSRDRSRRSHEAPARHWHRATQYMTAAADHFVARSTSWQISGRPTCQSQNFAVAPRTSVQLLASAVAKEFGLEACARIAAVPPVAHKRASKVLVAKRQWCLSISWHRRRTVKRRCRKRLRPGGYRGRTRRFCRPCDGVATGDVGKQGIFCAQVVRGKRRKEPAGAIRGATAAFFWPYKPDVNLAKDYPSFGRMAACLAFASCRPCFEPPA